MPLHTPSAAASRLELIYNNVYGVTRRKQPAVTTGPLSAASPSIAAGFDLGPVDQISFAVTSVELSMPWYEALFGGPGLFPELPRTLVEAGRRRGPP